LRRLAVPVMSCECPVANAFGGNSIGVDAYGPAVHAHLWRLLPDRLGIVEVARDLENIQMCSHALVGRSLTLSGIADFLHHAIRERTIQPRPASRWRSARGSGAGDFGGYPARDAWLAAVECRGWPCSVRDMLALAADDPPDVASFA
jgi:hypothetical protein